MFEKKCCIFLHYILYCIYLKYIIIVNLSQFWLNKFVGCGPGSSVGIATDYGLKGPGSNPGGNEIFRPSGQAQPPVKWVLGLSRGNVRLGRAADHSPPSCAAVMKE